MSRYDSRSGRRSSNSSLLFPILISFFVGIGGILYVYENYKDKAKDTKDFAKESSEPTATADTFRDELKTSPVSDLALTTPAKPKSAPETKLGPRADAHPEQTAAAQQSPLPDLLGSDTVVRRALIRLSPGLANWLSTDQLVRRFFLIANDFSQNQRVTSHMSFLRLQDPFFVEQDGNDLYIAPKNYQRYQLFTEAIQAIDTKKSANLYLRFRPLLMQVFIEMGYPKDITLESIINKAAGEIIAAPVIEEPIMLKRPSVYYRFADPKMEGFNPVQKQMIRMGPENTRIIQAKCREFLVELGKLDLK